MRLPLLLAAVIIYAEAHSGIFWMPKLFVIKSKRPMLKYNKAGYNKGYNKFEKVNYILPSRKFLKQGNIHKPNSNYYASKSILRQSAGKIRVPGSKVRTPYTYSTQRGLPWIDVTGLGNWGSQSVIVNNVQRGYPWIDITGVGNTPTRAIQGSELAGQSSTVSIWPGRVDFQGAQRGIPYVDAQGVQRGYPHIDLQDVQSGIPYVNTQGVQRGYPYIDLQGVQNGIPYVDSQGIQRGYPYVDVRGFQRTFPFVDVADGGSSFGVEIQGSELNTQSATQESTVGQSSTAGVTTAQSGVPFVDLSSSANTGNSPTVQSFQDSALTAQSLLNDPSVSDGQDQGLPGLLASDARNSDGTGTEVFPVNDVMDSGLEDVVGVKQ